MRTTTVILVWLFSFSAIAECWLCVPDDNAGFDYDKTTKTWVQTRFQMDEKYVVRASKTQNFKWEIVETGETYPSYYCEDDFSEHGYLTCSTAAEFRFNKNTLKFVLGSTYGFFGDAEVLAKRGRVPDSMYIVFGRCTAI